MILLERWLRYPSDAVADFFDSRLGGRIIAFYQFRWMITPFEQANEVPFVAIFSYQFQHRRGSNELS